MTNIRNHQSDRADKFVLRFTNSNMRQEMKARAAQNRRSMNAEILCLIDAGLEAEKENAPEAATSDASMQ